MKHVSLQNVLTIAEARKIAGDAEDPLDAVVEHCLSAADTALNASDLDVTSEDVTEWLVELRGVTTDAPAGLPVRKPTGPLPDVDLLMVNVSAHVGEVEQ